MKTMMLVALAALVAFAPHVSAQSGCTPTSADPSTLNEFDANGNHYYVEERGNPLGTSPPVPGSGFVLGDGTWIYQESNLLAGLQRGGIGLTGSCLPPDPAPCVIIDKDPINDETCGSGPDTIIE